MNFDASWGYSVLLYITIICTFLSFATLLISIGIMVYDVIRYLIKSKTRFLKYKKEKAK